MSVQKILDKIGVQKGALNQAHVAMDRGVYKPKMDMSCVDSKLSKCTSWAGYNIG